MKNKIRPRIEVNAMQVDIVDFPETNFPETVVAALEHLGPENQTYKTSINFIRCAREMVFQQIKEIPTGFITQTPTTLPRKTFAWTFVSL